MYEHHFGETDAGNSDYYNDLYFENEEDDFRYAEDYDRGMPTQIFVFSLYCKILTYSLMVLLSPLTSIMIISTPSLYHFGY